MILTRGLSRESEDKGTFGIWAMYITIITLFETIKQGLLRNPTIKFLGQAEHVEMKKEVQSSSLVINVLCSILAILMFTVGGHFIAGLNKMPELIPLLFWSSFFVLLLIPYNHYEILLQANYQFPKIFWAYFVRQAIFFVSVVLLCFVFPQYLTLLNLVFTQIIALGAGTCILFVATSPYRLRGFHYNTAIMGKMLHFGKYIFGTNLFSNIARNFDHFITAATMSATEGKIFVGYYNMVARVNNMLDVPSLAAADVLFPKNVETLETDGMGKVKYYFERMMGTILALVIPLSLGIFIFPKLIVNILGGQHNYDGAIPILQLTILFSLVRPLGFQFGSTLDAIGKPQVNFYVSVFLMLFNLGAVYLGLRNFGGIGAAYGTIIYNTVSAFVLIMILKKYVHVEVGNIFKYMFQAYKDLFGFARRKLIKSSGS